MVTQEMLDFAKQQSAYFAEVDAFELDIEYVELPVDDSLEVSQRLSQGAPVVAEAAAPSLPQPPLAPLVAAGATTSSTDENVAPEPAKRKVVGRKRNTGHTKAEKALQTKGEAVDSSKLISARDLSVLMHAMDESVLVPSTPSHGSARTQPENGMLTASKVGHLMTALDESVMVPSTPGQEAPLAELMDAMNTTATQSTPASYNEKPSVAMENVQQNASTMMNVADFERLVSRLDESTEHVNISMHHNESVFHNVAEFDKLFRAVDAETSMRASIYDTRVADGGRKSSVLITERPEEQDLLTVFSNKH